MSEQNIPDADIDLQRLAMDCDVCERTFQRALAGKPLKPRIRRRIRRALTERGLLGLLPPEPAQAVAPAGAAK